MTTIESLRAATKMEAIEKCQVWLDGEMAEGVRAAIPGTDNLIMVGTGAWIAGNVPEGDAGVPVAWAVTAERGGIHKLSITRESAERKAAVWREEWPDNGCRVRPLVFGDAPAQTGSDDELRQTEGYKLGWMEGMQEGAELATDGMALGVEEQFAALLPGSYYMDPPDGGSPSVLEQVRRMAEDAAQWRAHIAAAPKAAQMPDAAMGETEALRRRVSQLEAARMAYASEFPLNADGEPDVGSIHANIRALKAQVAATVAQGEQADGGVA